MKPTAITHLLIALSLLTPAFAENFNSVVSAGNIKSSGGHIFTDVGYVKAQTYFYTPGYVQAGTTGTFGGTVTAAGVQGNSWLYTPGYLSATGYGLIGNFLRVGGAANTPASKAVQIGQYATTDSFNALVVGQHNLNKAKDGTTAPNSTAWNSNDPLFEVGNGADANNKKNAFTIYKDGTVTMSQAQGDILMGQFGN